MHRKSNKKNMKRPTDGRSQSPKQEPNLMSLARMRHIFEPHLQLLRKNLFLSDDLVILHGDPHVFTLVLQQPPPYAINDHRMGILVQGEIHANINLVEKQITAGSIIFFGPGTLITPSYFSPDVEIYGFALSPTFCMPFAAGQMPSAFNGQVRDFQLPASEADIATARQILETLWHVVHQHDYDRQLIGSLIAAQMHHYDNLFRRYTTQQQVTQSREQTIFDRFILFVNQYAVDEHQIAFYASKMCLTERYLGTVVRQASGVTAKEWIDRALIARIKVELRHTDKSVARISEEMNFPNPSFFSKYFKRLTQKTPAEYRNSY